MEMLRMFLSRIRALFLQGRLDRELGEELRGHIEMAIEENLRRGMTRKEAHTAALRELGGVAQICEQYRAQPALPWIETLVQDARYALRQLRKAPGFALIVISMLWRRCALIAGLGIYGVLAYSLSLRTQEFGIRMALGSSRSGLARLVLRDASYPVLDGVLQGLLGAAGAVRWVRSLLYETSIADPWAIGFSLTLLLGAAPLAALLSLRKAASVDPMQTLRTE